MQILLLQTGSIIDALKSSPGDFDRLFARHLPQGWHLHAIPCQHQAPPELDPYDAVLISGSPAMVTENHPWSMAVEAWIRRHADSRPMLGVCYGHQLIARALGGRVGNNPRGREIGTQILQRVGGEDDPLFHRLPQRFPVQTTHVQSVLQLPDGATLLAKTALDPHHAFRWGRQTWGVQFHPEFDARIMRAYLSHRRHAIKAEGISLVELQFNVRETHLGQYVLARFLDLIQPARAH